MGTDNTHQRGDHQKVVANQVEKNKGGQGSQQLKDDKTSEWAAKKNGIPSKRTQK